MTTRADARLIALPNGERIPPAVARLTGISERNVQDGVDAHVAWDAALHWSRDDSRFTNGSPTGDL